jgi:hypothetical protein
MVAIAGRLGRFPRRKGARRFGSVVNAWVKPDRIEFRQEFSIDNPKWTEMAHGVGTKTAVEGNSQEAVS